MSQPVRPLPALTPPAPAPFFAKLEDLWRWQLDQLGPPASWPADERDELAPLYASLRTRLGLTG